jgi:hypothetical protein
MDHPTSLLSIAVVSSALSPAALTAAALWGGESWASVLMSGFAVAITIPLMVAIAAIPIVLARLGWRSDSGWFRR